MMNRCILQSYHCTLLQYAINGVGEGTGRLLKKQWRKLIKLAEGSCRKRKDTLLWRQKPLPLSRESYGRFSTAC
jgi:hypothetical protein